MVDINNQYLNYFINFYKKMIDEIMNLFEEINMDLKRIKELKNDELEDFTKEHNLQLDKITRENNKLLIELKKFIYFSDSYIFTLNLNKFIKDLSLIHKEIVIFLGKEDEIHSYLDLNKNNYNMDDLKNIVKLINKDLLELDTFIQKMETKKTLLKKAKHNLIYNNYKMNVSMKISDTKNKKFYFRNKISMISDFIIYNLNKLKIKIKNDIDFLQPKF